MTLPFLHGVAQRSPTSAFVIYSLFPTLARPDDVYLGLDLSTQQLKCTVINNQHHIVVEDAVNFDKDLPEFATRNGAIEEDGDVVTVPTLMWVKALDMLIEKMRKDYGFNFGRVRGIAGAGQGSEDRWNGLPQFHRQLAPFMLFMLHAHTFPPPLIPQQHGSVYWARGASDLLSSLDPSQSLHTQLGETTFAIPRSPIWQDASTTEQCRALEEVVGGPQKLADLTGSRAYERFTGNQIAKVGFRVGV
ncbi:hypothetical protein BC938DRAFT_477952 [Jimgerdemannia flammicorona]|uniref:Carbohydrate kinase FGGY N-terminal domain-containing protein n=1 Tax=Jimgerdemannia flammicorona TaxID=994334 RepID=A0A433P731_9FUNG|nr:hypothetical protein BC938DRAFT_477952 [Jimgerdemannia flammicorona]